ncbi:MAG: hypothetical protein IPM41_15985 [Sphingomonadales bacterium]|nr:hypothetical protein [Sphingomonadales bacterium]
MPYADPEKDGQKCRSGIPATPIIRRNSMPSIGQSALPLRLLHTRRSLKKCAQGIKKAMQNLQKSALPSKGHIEPRIGKTNKEARESYHRNKAKRRKTKLAYYKKNYDKIYSYIQDWRKRNPERELLYHAKRLLNEAVGIRIAEIPQDLAIAKAEQIKVLRAAKAIEAHSGQTEGLDRNGESAVGVTDLP